MTTVPVNKRHHLLAFCTLHHLQQKRKYTGEPYINHCREVAEMADKRKIWMGYEIGLCHDLFEDTECNGVDLYEALIRFGYTEFEADYITQGVDDLTDHYTHENYPDKNRAERKLLEAQRLGKIKHASQSVKYCDLISNTKSIVEHDPNFAKVYLIEKSNILLHMCNGHKVLYRWAKESLFKGLEALNKLEADGKASN